MEVYYKPSDIVWVKLGPFWWPGEVVDKSSVPEDLVETLKREPVAIVKFFDDDGYYEFVKTPEGIHPYNCERKYDFIKKGMDAFRAKNPKMTSFPKDVSAAEVKTGGNANILSDPVFTIDRKRNYAAEIFGSPTVKKPRESNKARAIKSEPIITHRRFLGYDDYEARVLIPTAEDADEKDVDAPASAAPRAETFSKFTCPICQFSTDRLGILMKHTSCHVKDVSFQSRQPIKKQQKRKRRKALSDDDLSGDEKKTKTKRKYTKKKVDESVLADDERSENDVSFSAKDSTTRKYAKKPPQPKAEEKKDVCIDIIADWDDESNHEDSNEKDTTLDSTLNETEDLSEVAANSISVDTSFGLQLTDEDLDSTRITKEITEDPEVSKDKPTDDKTEKSPNKSCFDFEEDDEEAKIPDATSGRKIPRVIPISERRKTVEEEDEEEERRKKKILEESEELAKLIEPTTEGDKEAENLEKTYQSLMESTENLDIPDVPNILKTEQNFHSVRTVKYPDKGEGETSDLIEAEKTEETGKIEETIGILDVVEDVTFVVEAQPESTKGEESGKSKEKEDEESESSKKMKDEKSEPSKEKKDDKSENSKEKKDEKSESCKEMKDEKSESSKQKKDEKSGSSKERAKSKFTKSVRKSSRFKPEITESAIDALLLKQAEETEKFEVEKGCETAKNEVPSDTPTVSEEEKTESNLEDQVKTLEEEPVQIVENKTIDSEDMSQEKVLEKEIERTEDKKLETEVVEASIVEEPPSVPEEKNTPEDSHGKIVIDTEVVLNHVEEEVQPDTKRRKTLRGYSRSSNVREDSSPRRGRSKDAEALKAEERRRSSTPEKSRKEQHKSTRKSRWDKGTTKKDETQDENQKLPTQDEINNVILGTVEAKESVEDSTSKSELSAENSENNISNSESGPHNENVEKENSLETPKTPSSKGDKGKHDQKEEESPVNAEEASEKISEKNEKDHRSHRSSSRKEKKSSRSERDQKKDEVSATPDDSSHRNSRSSRRSSRHEKGKHDSSEVGRKEPHQEEQTAKEEKVKESTHSRKSGSSKAANVEVPVNEDREENVLRRSSRKDKKTDNADQIPQKSPVKEAANDTKLHVSSSRSSKRQSRSSKTSQDPLTSPDAKVPVAKEQDVSNKEENAEPQSSGKKSEKVSKQDRIDPIRDLFAGSGHVSKTKEQKREELKNIFSFDYDEKDLRKRRTYGHRRKSRHTYEEIDQPEESKKTEVTPETNQTLPAEVEKGVTEETVIQTGSEEINKVEEMTKSSELDVTKDETRECPGKIGEVQNVDSGELPKEEATSTLAVQMAEASVHPDLSVKEDKTKIVIETEPPNPVYEKIEIPQPKLDHTSPEDADKQTENLDTQEKKIEVSNIPEEKKETDKSTKTVVKKQRKPSRWDQKEKTDSSTNHERKKSRWDKVKTEEESQPQSSEVEASTKVTTAIAAQTSLDFDDTSQKEMNDIFSGKEPSDLAEKNAAQIELIFGSSPLPVLNENSVFLEKNKEPESDQKESSEETVATQVENSSKNSSFELAPDLMDSVESQVARITHYEEPNAEREESKKLDSPEAQKSIFDTPEKSEKTTLEETLDVARTSSEKSESEPDKTESKQTNSAPKPKKTHLLTEKTKPEKEEKSPDTPKETPDPPIKPIDKTNEVATKLTNPKKRFVKSFEDFELNQQREKTLEAEKANTQETKPETSLITGKSPIAFKLKKQFLSKISSIFDEADEKKETKVLPRLKAIKNDHTLLPKKKISAGSAKTETTTAKSGDVSKTKTEKTPESLEKSNMEHSEKKTEISDVDNNVPKSAPVSEDSGELCQKKIETDVTKNEDLPLSEVHQSAEVNPVEFCEEASESNANIPEVSKDGNAPEQHSVALEFLLKEHPDFPEPVLEEPTKIHAPILEAELTNRQEEDHISKTEIITKNFPLDENKKEETEYVSIDGNLTVVSEKELAEGQVEITASMPGKKPMTLLNFSMDFSDDSSDASFEAFRKEKIQNITESLDAKSMEDEIKEKEVIVEKERTIEIEEICENVDNKDNTVVIESKEVTVESNEEQPHIAQLENDKTIETKEEQPAYNNKIETIITGEIEENIDVNVKSQIVEKVLGDIPNVSQDIEIENVQSVAPNIQIESKNEKTEIQKDKIDVAKSTSDKKEKETHGDTVLPAPIEVKTTTKSPETARGKGKDSARKNDRKNQHSATEHNQVVNEPMVIYNTAKSSTVTDMCDLEDHIPSQIVCTKINEEVMKVAGINNELTKEGALSKNEPEMSKLLSRLTSDKKEDPISKIKEAESKTREPEPLSTPKNLLKAAIKSKTANANTPLPPKPMNKAIILSEKIIRPAREVAAVVRKRTYEDVEDIEPYVITKTAKIDETTIVSQKVQSSTSKVPSNSPKQFVINSNKQLVGMKKSGKAKILNQTIIRPAGETIQTNKLPGAEDNVDFDINSMPIVLSDELLTPETLENMPIVLGDQSQKTAPSGENMKIIVDKKNQGNAKLVSKTVAMASTPAAGSPTVRMPVLKRTTPKILQTPRPAQKIIRQVTPMVGSKSGKFVVVSESANRTPQVVKKQPNLLRKTAPVTCASQSTPSESTGHKIMIFTNQQGKQQRLLLTPAQQKMFGMQLPGKTVVKSATAAQKSQLAKVQTTALASTSKLPGQIQSPKLAKTTSGNSQVPSPQMKIVPPRKPAPKTPGQQVGKPQQKTILITNQHGQTVRKIQGTNEALLDKQVAEQLEAIKVSSMKAQLKQQEANARSAVLSKPHPVPARKQVVKRPEPKQTVVAQTKLPHPSISGTSRSNEPKVPPLTPINKQERKPDSEKPGQSKPAQNKQDRPLHQLVIQDNMGNQTTITEGQILALPSETVDGQPQSYMLVTLDETGNLTPLNNEALMSLDPSLAGLAGGDLSNMVLQMDAGTSKDNVNQTAQLQAAQPPPPPVPAEKPPKPEAGPPKPEQRVEQAQVQVTCNINGEPGQQIILTGDPVATQKFLDSLSDGSTDLANILAGAEGNSFLIQADGQQILINTEPNETAMLQANANIEQGSPMFSTHAAKNQDILAAALADTDVFQQDHVTGQGKLTHSQLSPGQTLFPMNVGNVLETSLTLNSPIMTPLEVPSTNSKRIPDEEADILTTHVPKNVDLPITITDPNISQTVSHQQVLMASDLQSNLELTLPISETISVTSDINSPSFVYSLPNLGVSEHAETIQKNFSGSMPLLTEDTEESHASSKPPETNLTRTQPEIAQTKKQSVARGLRQNLISRRMAQGGAFMEEGLCTLGAEMCSSLSEPPPEMFDIPMENDAIDFLTKSQNAEDKSNPSSAESGLLTDDSSLEVPVQSRTVSDFKDSSQSSDSSSSVSQDKTL